MAALLLAASAVAAATASLPKRTVPVPLRDLVLPVPVSGKLDYDAVGNGAADVRGQFTGDLSAAQRQSTAVLRALLDRDTSCGDRIAVQDGRIGARRQALRLTGTIDYERVACLAGRQVVLLPRTPMQVDLLLHPVVGARSLRVRTEVLDVRPAGRDLPPSVAEPLKQALGSVIDERVGELFPAGAVPPDMLLQEVRFEEGKEGRLLAQLRASGRLPQSLLDRLLRAR